MGLYQVALSLFAVFLTFGTGGIPITLSRLISKNKAENNPRGESGAVTAGVLLCLLVTLPFVLLFECFPSLSTPFFSGTNGVSVFRILLLGLCFSALYAVFRGFFWGNKQFLLPSILEIAEESVMVVAGVLLLKGAQNAVQGANLAAWAVVVSYLFSFTASLLCFLFCKGKFSNPKPQLKPLFAAALPVTSVKASGSLLSSAVAVLLPVMLVRSGATHTEAVTLFGIVSGMAIPVLFIPSTIIGSISLVLVPELAEDYYRGNVRRLYHNIARGLTVAFLVACFLLPFFYAVGEELGQVAFSQSMAGQFIRNGCPILLPMSMTMISTGILNSIGFERQTFIFYFVGAAAMLLCIVFLPAFCGAYAYVVGLGCSFFVTALCNFIFLHKKCHGLFAVMRQKNTRNGWRTLAKALCCILPLSLVGGLMKSLFSRFLGLFFSLFLTILSLGLITAITWVLLDILPLRFFLQKRGKRQKNKGFY